MGKMALSFTSSGLLSLAGGVPSLAHRWLLTNHLIHCRRQRSHTRQEDLGPIERWRGAGIERMLNCATLLVTRFLVPILIRYITPDSISTTSQGTVQNLCIPLFFKGCNINAFCPASYNIGFNPLSQYFFCLSADLLMWCHAI